MKHLQAIIAANKTSSAHREYHLAQAKAWADMPIEGEAVKTLQAFMSGKGVSVSEEEARVIIADNRAHAAKRERVTAYAL